MSHKLSNLSQVFRLAGLMALAGALMAGSASATAVQANTPSLQAPGRRTQQGFNINLCKINGNLARPPKGNWTFVLNFDHPTSTTTALGCLAEMQGGGVVYTSKNCAVINPTAGSSVFGGGNGVFAGNAYLQCDGLPTSPAEPEGFGVSAYASFPNPNRMHTLANSTPLSFTVQTNAACNMLLSSRYGSNTFQSGTNYACGTFTEVSTRYTKPPTQQNVRHSKDGAPIGSATLNIPLGIPSPFNVSIGAVNQAFTLDWLMIDPPRNSGGE